MAFSTAVSVGAFSVVLTQSFVAVAASTLVPAAFLSAARAARAAAAASGAGSGTGGGASGDGNALIASAPGVSEVMDTLRAGISRVDDVDLLVPKSARIEAEFEFEASEAYSADASLGGMVNVVSVSAGYSALYTTSTRNKIKLEVDFAVVNYRIAAES